MHTSKKNQYPTGIYVFDTKMEKKWTKWYAMTLHVVAYRSSELLFRTHALNFDCFLDDFNCVFMQTRCLSVLLMNHSIWIQSIKDWYSKVLR